MFNVYGFNGSTWYSTIINNIVSNNSWFGIYLEECSRYNTITGNTAYNNWIGIGLTENSSDNLIYHNNLINNTYQAFEEGINIWDKGVKWMEGNYWSDYDGFDGNGDGIGDTPYSINSDTQDNYPLMSPYIEGDVNHNGVVDIFDLAMAGRAYGFFSGEPEYNCHADLNQDGIVDMRDIAIVAINYGKTW